MAARYDLTANAHLLGEWGEEFDELDELDLERKITFDGISVNDVSCLIKKTSTPEKDTLTSLDSFYEC